MQWFDHSSTAASDDKVMALRLEHPDSGAVDCYWAIVEKQYADERPVIFDETDAETKSLCHRLCIGYEVGCKYVETMISVGLLKRDESDERAVYSVRAKESIEAYHRKCEVARENGKKGGRKPKAKPTRKPKANRQLTKGQANNNNNTCMGLDKLNPIHKASDGAAMDGTTPPAADDTKVPCCPLCARRLKFDPRSLKWQCPECGDVNAPDYREAVA